ncbi:MAG: DUF2306 domain-containing protein [Bacteroidota bacterium]
MESTDVRRINSTRFFVNLLGMIVWISTLLFGLYILAFYATSLVNGNPEQWNEMLPELYSANESVATTGIGFHFAAGGIILILGCIQLIEKFRKRFPRLHKAIGLLYIFSSIVAGVGGLIFIVTKGTIGGTVMNIGFALYGILMIIAAFMTAKHAFTHNIVQHRNWALRLFALAVGSWLYRMDYGFWFILADGAGHTRQFSGPFDQVMAFFFYIPNLLIVEFIIRSKKIQYSGILKFSYSTLLVLATIFISIGTYFFTVRFWGPAILSWFD